MSARMARPFTPAAQTFRSAVDPLARCGDDRLRRSPRRPACRSARGRRAPPAPCCAASASFSGSAGRMRGPASISVTSQPALVEHFEPVMAQRRGGIVEFGGQLDAGSAAADDRDPDMRVDCRIGAHPRATPAGSDRAACCGNGRPARGRRGTGNSRRRPWMPKSLVTDADREDEIIVADACAVRSARCRPRRARARS